MGLEAIAVLQVSIDRFRAVLHAVAASPGTFRGLGGQRLELRESADATLVHTHAPFSAEPEELGLVLRASLGALVDEHPDPRGIFVFPSVAKPKSGGYAGIVDEIGEAGFWVPCVDADPELEQAADALPEGLEGSMRDLMGALPPGALAQMQQALSRTDPGAMARAAEQLQGALAGGSGDLMGVLERTMAQARDMLLSGGLDELNLPPTAPDSPPAAQPGRPAAEPVGGPRAPEAAPLPASLRGGPVPPFIPDENQAPELWKQARAHVESLRASNPEHWQTFEQQLQQLAGAPPAAPEPSGAPAPKPPATTPSKPSGAHNRPGRAKKRKRR